MHMYLRLSFCVLLTRTRFLCDILAACGLSVLLNSYHTLLLFPKCWSPTPPPPFNRSPHFSVRHCSRLAWHQHADVLLTGSTNNGVIFPLAVHVKIPSMSACFYCLLLIHFSPSVFFPFKDSGLSSALLAGIHLNSHWAYKCPSMTTSSIPSKNHGPF